MENTLQDEKETTGGNSIKLYIIECLINQYNHGSMFILYGFSQAIDNKIFFGLVISEKSQCLFQNVIEAIS